MNLEVTLNLLRRIGFSEPEEEMPVITDEPKMPGYLCFPNSKAKERYHTETSFGQGFDTNRTKARIKSIGEMLERLCLDNPIQRRSLKSQFKTGEFFIDPSIFFCYSEEQNPNREENFEKLVDGTYLWWPIKDFLNYTKP